MAMIWRWDLPNDPRQFTSAGSAAPTRWQQRLRSWRQTVRLTSQARRLEWMADGESRPGPTTVVRRTARRRSDAAADVVEVVRQIAAIYVHSEYNGDNENAGDQRVFHHGYGAVVAAQPRPKPEAFAHGLLAP